MAGEIGCNWDSHTFTAAAAGIHLSMIVIQWAREKKYPLDEAAATQILAKQWRIDQERLRRALSTLIQHDHLI
jgi:hypothetical protein